MFSSWGFGDILNIYTEDHNCYIYLYITYFTVIQLSSYNHNFYFIIIILYILIHVRCMNTFII